MARTVLLNSAVILLRSITAVGPAASERKGQTERHALCVPSKGKQLPDFLGIAMPRLLFFSLRFGVVLWLKFIGCSFQNVSDFCEKYMGES